MKFIFKPRHNSHDNDCWCDAIALATEQEYDKVYKMFKPFMEDDGALDEQLLLGYFNKEGYDSIPTTDTLQTTLRLYNLKNGAIFTMKDSNEEFHAVYVKGNKIYDNYDSDMMWWYIKEYTLISVIIKLEKFD